MTILQFLPVINKENLMFFTFKLHVRTSRGRMVSVCMQECGLSAPEFASPKKQKRRG